MSLRPYHPYRPFPSYTELRNLARRVRPRLDTWSGGSATVTVQEDEERSKGMSGYNMSRAKHVRGRKPSRYVYNNRLVSNTVNHVVERFAKVSDPADVSGSNHGSTWLSYGTVGAGGVPATFTVIRDGTASSNNNLIRCPVHLFNLCTTSSNRAISLTPGGFPYGTVGWVLHAVSAGTALDRLAWMPVKAWDRNTFVDPGVYPAGNLNEWEVEDNGAGNVAGATQLYANRSALMEWSEVRCLFYGKKTRPTNIVASFVTFDDETLCPEFEGYQGGNLSGTAIYAVDPQSESFWKTRVQHLINNPCTVTKDVNQAERKAGMRVLSSFTIKIAPKDTSEADADPHQKYHRWFNKWYRKVDYTYANRGNNLNTRSMEDPNRNPANASDSCKIPNSLKGCVYFMLTSYQPDKQETTVEEAGPTNTFTASYDFNIRKSTGVLAGTGNPGT